MWNLQGKMNLEKTVLWRFGMKTPKKLNGITEPMSQRDFENGPLLRDVVAETSRGMAHNRLESISIVTLVVMLDCCSHCWLLKTTAHRAAPKFRPCDSLPWPQRCPNLCRHSRRRRRAMLLRSLPLRAERRHR